MPKHLLARCLELAPGFHAARHNYALVLHRGNKPAEALAEIETLLADRPANPGYRNLKAVVLCRIGDYEPAIEIYDGHAARVSRSTPKIWMSYGHALKTAGYQDRAHRRLSQEHRAGSGLRRRRGGAWPTSRRSASRERTSTPCARSWQRPDLATEHRLHFEFALGKALEDAGDYADVVPPLRAGQRAAPRRGAVQRRRHHRRACAASSAVFTPRILRAARAAAARTRRIRSSSSACRARARR